MTTQIRSKPCKPYSGVAVLTRAYALLNAGPLNGKVCGDFCPWCALDEAHRQLSMEFQIKAPLHNVLTRLVAAAFMSSSFKEPLIDAARDITPQLYQKITQKEALYVLRRAGAWVEEDKPRKAIRYCTNCGLEVYTTLELCPECRRAGGPG